MNYRCDECGHIFEQGEEKITIQPHGEEMSECPLCGGSYEEVQECEICGEPLNNDERKFCSSCKKDIADKIKCFFETFNSLEKKFISELQEDGELDVLMGMGGEK